MAIFHDDRSIVETLLKKDTDMNAFDEYLDNILYTAVYRDNIDIIAILFEYGVNVNKF
jgi:ankyrin repeat protein